MNVSSVSPAAFREWIAPHVEGIRALTVAIEAVRDRHGALPAATSQAMTEVAEEQGYRRRSNWEQPLTDTHMLAGMALQAGTDYVRGLAELFDSAHPPVYCHLALARGALEASVVSAWLSEPGITTLERIKRGLCEFLYSAPEVKELNLGSDGAAKVTWWNDVAQSFGWEVAGGRGRPTIDGTRRPRIGDEVTRLTEADADARLGDLLYSHFSAVDHVTWFGLMSALDIGAAERDERAGTANVPVTVDGGRVATYVYYVVRALRAAAQTRFTTFGWADADWSFATERVGKLEEALLRIAVQNRPDSVWP
jgi:hypothetical protein